MIEGFIQNYSTFEYDRTAKAVRLEFAADNVTNLGQDLQLKLYSLYD